MTKDELWNAYVTRNPKFAESGNVVLSAAGLKKLFDQTWEKAFTAGIDSKCDQHPKDDYSDILQQMFKRK